MSSLHMARAAGLDLTQNYGGTNATRVKAYKSRMKAAGYARVSVWLHPDALERLKEETGRNECYGRMIERLLTGKSFHRPRK
ncbi:MAG: hypothetical protein ACSHXK_05755 [Oceanococcus sp.]